MAQTSLLRSSCLVGSPVLSAPATGASRHRSDRQHHIVLAAQISSAQSVSPSHHQGAFLRKGNFLGQTLPARPHHLFQSKHSSGNPQLNNQPVHRRTAVPVARLTVEKEAEIQTGPHESRPEDLSLPPGSLGLPIIGETLDFIRAQDPENPRTFFGPRMTKYGKIFKSNVLGGNFIHVSGPEAAAQVFTNGKLYRSQWPKAFKPLIGEHAVSMSNGRKHAYLRHLVSNPLSIDNLKTYVPLIEKASLALMESWKDKASLKVHPEMRRLTFNVISELIFGAKPGSQTERLSELFDVWVRGLASLFPFDVPFTTFGKSMNARCAILDELAQNISERREATARGGSVPHDILTRLLNEKDSEGRQLTQLELQDNLLNLLFAGHDTSASSLSIIIHSLGTSPDVVQKLRDEHARIRSAKAAGEPLTWQDVRQMTYTDQVISEGLRLRPIVSSVFKVATEETSLYGYRVPKGWSVTLDFGSVMGRDSYFPEADKFLPERFDEKPQPYTFLPFGSGERQCPGSALARLEMSIFLYHFLYLWDFTLVNPSEGILFIPLVRPKEGLPVKLQRRLSAS